MKSRVVLSGKYTGIVLFFSSLLISFVVLNFKKPEAFTHSQFWAEDGHIFFQEAFNRGISSFLVSYNGYLHLIPRFVAWLVSLSRNYALAPFLYNLASLAGFIFVFFYIWARTSYGIWVRFFMSLALALAPVGNEIVLTLTNLHSYTALLIILIFMTDQEKRTAIPDNITIGFVGLTGPFSLIFLPAVLFLYYFNVVKNKVQTIRKVTLGIYIATAIVQLLVLKSFNPGVRGDVGLTAKLATLPHMVYLQLLNLIGWPAFYTLQTNHLVLFLLCVAFALWVFVCFVQYKKTKNVLLFFLLIAAWSLTASSVYRVIANTDPFTPLREARYFFIPTTLFLWSFIIYTSQETRKLFLFAVVYVWYLFVDVKLISPWLLENKHWESEARRIESFDKGQLQIPINPTGWDVRLER